MGLLVVKSILFKYFYSYGTMQIILLTIKCQNMREQSALDEANSELFDCI